MKKVIIHGNVQGVFFRKFVEENAVKLKLKGYVKNLEDGSVEAVFDGEKIDEMIKLCWEGPLGAKVDDIEISDFEGNFENFEIMY